MFLQNNKKERGIQLKKAISNKKYIIAMLALLLILAIGVTYTVSIYVLKLNNKINTATVSGQIIEEFPEQDINWDAGETNIKKVFFKNTGSADVFLRVSYGEVWHYIDEENKTYMLNNLYDSGNGSVEIVQKLWTDDWRNDWQDGGDGWIYYKKVLKSQDSTAPVLDGLNFHNNNDDKYKSADYKLTFQMEVVQASDELKVSHDAVKMLFNKDFVLAVESQEDWESQKYNVIFTWQSS